METLEMEQVKTEKQLPEGWEWKKLGEVCEFIYGKALKKEMRNEIGEYPVYGSNGVVGYHNEYLVEGPAIIVGRKGAAGEVHYSGRNAWPIDTTYFIKPDNVDGKFLYYQLRTLRLQSLDKSTAIPGLNRNDAYAKSVAVPPLTEQHAIVEKIEALFSELDHAIAQLQAAKQQLHTYRQSVLKYAFEGYYTGGMEGWEEGIIKNVSAKVQIGPFGSQLHKEDYISGGIPLINPMHIKGGQIVADSEYSITVEKRESLPNYILQKGDVIMGRRGEMGRCALVTEKEHGWFCGTGSLYIRPDARRVDSRFLTMYLSGRGVKEFLENEAAGTTMTNLNLKIVNSIPFKHPDIKTQQQIVSEIEARLSESDHLLTTINNQLTQSEALRQSILQRAFEGRL